ncbi:MAG: response regulator [Betaproteobacteria bacterium]
MSFIRSLFNKTITPEPQPQEAPKTTPEVVEDSGPVERRSRRRVNARGGVRVLIIDDSPTIVAALAKTLRSAGYVTLEALDAEGGLKVARREKPELIFLDIVLPGMSGFAALRLMRRDPVTQHIPVIMISGNEQAVEQFYANRIGADDFMKKPFSRAEVFARIEPLLDANLVPRRKNAPAEETPANPTATPAAGAAQPPAAVTAPMTATPSPVASTAPTPAPAEPVAEASLASLSPVAPVQNAVIAPTGTAPMEGLQAPVPVTPAPPAAPILQAVPPTSASAPAPAGPSSLSPLEARKELTSMGLQYFDQGQFIAAIQRGDKLAFELFVAGSGIDIAAETDGKTPLQVARENGRTQIFALLRARLAAANSV